MRLQRNWVSECQCPWNSYSHTQWMALGGMVLGGSDWVIRLHCHEWDFCPFRILSSPHHSWLCQQTMVNPKIIGIMKNSRSCLWCMFTYQTQHKNCHFVQPTPYRTPSNVVSPSSVSVTQLQLQSKTIKRRVPVMNSSWVKLHAIVRNEMKPYTITCHPTIPRIIPLSEYSCRKCFCPISYFIPTLVIRWGIVTQK